MKRITKNEPNYHGNTAHKRSLCFMKSDCLRTSCDGCEILALYRTIAALGDYAEKIEHIVSFTNAADIHNYIQRLAGIILRHQPMKPKTDGLDEQDSIVCPVCGYGLMPADADDYFGTPKHCSECGQLLQWNDNIPCCY